MNTYFYLSKILAPLLNLSNLLLVLFLCFLFFYLIFKKKIFKIFVFIFSIIFFVISFFPIGNFMLGYLEKDFYSEKIPTKVNTIVVLAGAESGKKTFFHKRLHLGDSSERLIAFVKLANKHPKAELIYLGGSPYLNNSNSLSEPEVAKVFFKDVNFDYQKVVFLNTSRNTIENLKDLKSYSESKKLKNILLITSASHMKRCIYIGKKIKLDFFTYSVNFKSLIQESFLNGWQGFSVVSNLSSLNSFWREILGIFAINFVATK